mgnify:CR=1 FL=1|jgi:hypothetical protein
MLVYHAFKVLFHGKTQKKSLLIPQRKFFHLSLQPIFTILQTSISNGTDIEICGRAVTTQGRIS